MEFCPKCQNIVNRDDLLCQNCGENLKNRRLGGKEFPKIVPTAQPQDSTACTQPVCTETAPVNSAPQAKQTVSWKISKTAHDDIVRRFSQMHDHHIGHHSSPNPNWTESELMIALSDKWEHWIGHDDTISRCINLSFSKVWQRIENVPWETESEWPCGGQALLFDKSRSDGSDEPWDPHYSYVRHKAWLLKEPYGLSGIWRFEYRASERRC